MDDRLYYEESRNSFFPHRRRQRLRVHQRVGSDKTDTSQNCSFATSTPVKPPKKLKRHKQLSRSIEQLSKTSSEKREFHTDIDKSLNTNNLSCNNNVTKFRGKEIVLQDQVSSKLEGKNKAEKAAPNKIKSMYNVEEQTQLANACTRTGDLYSSSATDILMDRNPNKEFDLISHILDESCQEIDLEDRPKKPQVLEVNDDTDERKEETESSFSDQGDNDSITEFDSVSNIGRPLISRYIPPPFEDVREEDSSSTYVSEYPNYRRPIPIRHRSFDYVRKRRSTQAPELQTRTPFNYFHQGFERPLPKHPSISHSHLMPHPHMHMDKSNNMLIRSRQPIQHWNNAMIPIDDDRTNTCTRQEPSLEDRHNDDLVQYGKVLEDGNKNPIIRPIPHNSSGVSYAHGDEHETSGYISESCPTKDRKRKLSDVTSVINAKRPCNPQEEDLYYCGYQNFKDPRNTPEFGFHSNPNYSVPVPYQQDWSNVYHPSYDWSRQSEIRRNPIDDPYDEFLRYENRDSRRLLELRRQQMFADNYYSNRGDYGCYPNFDGHLNGRDDHFRPKQQNMDPFPPKKYNLIQENYQHDNPKMFASAASRSKKKANERVVSNYQDEKLWLNEGHEEFWESPLEAFKKSEEPIFRNDQGPNSSSKKTQAISCHELKNSLLKEIDEIPESKTSNSNELALEKDKISDAYVGMDTESSVLLVASPIQITKRKPKLKITNRRHVKKAKYLKMDGACLVESTSEKPTTEMANVKKKVGRPRKNPAAPVVSVTKSNHEILSDTALTENPDKSMSENTAELAKNDQNKCVTRELNGLTTLEEKRKTRHSRRESICDDESKGFTQMKKPDICEQRLGKDAIICLSSSTEEELNLLQTDNESSVFEKQLSPTFNQRPGSANSVHSTVDYDNQDKTFSSKESDDNALKTIIDDEVTSHYEENFDEISPKPTRLDLATSTCTPEINPEEISSKQQSDKSLSRSKIPEYLPKRTSSKANSEDRDVTFPKRDKCSSNTNVNHKETNSESSNISEITSPSKSNLNETVANLRLFENNHGEADDAEKKVTEWKEKDKSCSTGIKLRQGHSYLNTIKSCSIKLTKVPIPVPIRKKSVLENQHALNKDRDHVAKEKDAASLPLFDQMKSTNTLTTDDIHSKHTKHETRTGKDKSTDVEAVDSGQVDSTHYQPPSELAKYSTELIIDLTSFDSSTDCEDGSGSDKLRQENTSLKIKPKFQRQENVNVSNSPNYTAPSNSSYQTMKNQENYVLTFANLQSVMCPSERPNNFGHECPTATSVSSNLLNNDRNVSIGSQHKIPPKRYPFILPSVSLPKPSASISCIKPLATTFDSFTHPSASRAFTRLLVSTPEVSFDKNICNSSVKPVQALKNISPEPHKQPKSTGDNLKFSNSTQNTEGDNVVNEDEPTEYRRSTRRQKRGLLKISEKLFCGKKGKKESQNGKNEKKLKRNSEKEHEMINPDSRSKLKTTLSKRKLKGKPSMNQISKSFELKSVPMSFVYKIPIKSSLTEPQSSSSEEQSAKTTSTKQNKKMTVKKSTNQTDDKVTLLQTPSPVTGPIKNHSLTTSIIQPMNKYLVFQNISTNTNTQNKPVNFLMSPGNESIRPSFYLVPCSKSHLFLPANKPGINSYPAILTSVLQPPTPVTTQNVQTSSGPPLGKPPSSTTETSLSQTQITTSLKQSDLVCSFGCSQTRMSTSQYVTIPLTPTQNPLRSSLGKPKDASLHPLNKQTKAAHFPCGINSVQPVMGQAIWKSPESASMHLKSPSSQPPPFSILKTYGVPSSYEVTSSLTVSQLLGQSKMCNSTAAQNDFCSPQQSQTSIKATLDTTMLARNGPTSQKEARSSDQLKDMPTELHQCRAELSTEVNKTNNVKSPYSQRQHRVTSSDEKIIEPNKHPVRMTRLRQAINHSSCKETQTSGVEGNRLNPPVMPVNVTNRRITRLSYRNAQMKNTLSCAAISNSTKIGELITMGGDELKNNKILTSSQNLSQDEPDNTRLHPKTTEFDNSVKTGPHMEMFHDVPRDVLFINESQSPLNNDYVFDKAVDPEIMPLDKPIYDNSTPCNESVCPSTQPLSYSADSRPQDESINTDGLQVTANNQSEDHSVSYDNQTQDRPISYDRLEDEPISVKKLENEPISANNVEDKLNSSGKVQKEPISDDKLGYKPINTANLEDRPISVDKLEDEAISADQSHVEPISADKLQAEPVSTDMLQDELISNADKLGDGPISSDQSCDKIISSDQLQEGPISTNDDEPISTDKLQVKLISSQKVHNKPFGANNLQDELIRTDNVQYIPVDANKLQESGSHENLHEEPINTAKLEYDAMSIDKLEEEPISGDKLDYEPMSFNHSHIEPVCADKLPEEPTSADTLPDEPINIDSLPDELISSDKIHNEPISADNCKKLSSADKLQKSESREKLQNEPITVEKLGDEPISTAKLEYEPIIVDKLEDEPVSADQSHIETISADKLQEETNSAVKLQDELISGDNLQDNSVSADILQDCWSNETQNTSESMPCDNPVNADCHSQDKPVNADSHSHDETVNADNHSHDEPGNTESHSQHDRVGYKRLLQGELISTNSKTHSELMYTKCMACGKTDSTSSQSQDELGNDGKPLYKPDNTDCLSKEDAICTERLLNDQAISPFQEASFHTDKLSQDTPFCVDNLSHDVPMNTLSITCIGSLSLDTPLSTDNLSQDVPLNTDNLTQDAPSNTDNPSQEVSFGTDSLSQDTPLSTDSLSQDATLSTDNLSQDARLCTDNCMQVVTLDTTKLKQDAPLSTDNLSQDVPMHAPNNIKTKAHNGRVDAENRSHVEPMNNDCIQCDKPTNVNSQSYNEPVSAYSQSINSARKSKGEQISADKVFDEPFIIDSKSINQSVSEATDGTVSIKSSPNDETVSVDSSPNDEPISTENYLESHHRKSKDEPSIDSKAMVEAVSMDSKSNDILNPASKSLKELFISSNKSHNAPMNTGSIPINTYNKSHNEQSSSNSQSNDNIVNADNHGHCEPISATSRCHCESIANFTPQDLLVTADEPTNNNLSCIKHVCTEISDNVPASTILKSQDEDKAFQTTIKTDRIKAHRVQDEPLIVDDSLHNPPVNTDDSPDGSTMNNDSIQEHGPVKSDDAQQVEPLNTNELISTGHSPDNEQVSTNDSPYDPPVNSYKTPQDSLVNTDNSPNDGPIDNYHVEPLKSNVLKHDPLVDTGDSTHELLASTDNLIHDEPIYTDSLPQDAVVNTHTSPSDATVNIHHTWYDERLYTVNSSHDEAVNTDVLPLVNTDPPLVNSADETLVISATTGKPNDPPLNVATVHDSPVSINNPHHDETIKTDDLLHGAQVTTINSIQYESVENDNLQQNQLVNAIELPHDGLPNLYKSQDEPMEIVDSKHDVPMKIVESKHDVTVNTDKRLHDQPVTSDNLSQDACASIETTLHDGPLITVKSTEEVLKIVGFQHDVPVNRDSKPHDNPVNTDSSPQDAPISIEKPSHNGSLDAVKSKDESVITNNLPCYRTINTKGSPCDAPANFHNSQHDLLHCTPGNTVRIEESALDPLVSIDDSTQDLLTSTDASKPDKPTISIYHSLYKQPKQFYKSHNKSVNSDHLLQISTDTTQATVDKSSRDPLIKTDDSPRSGPVDTDIARLIETVNTEMSPHDPSILTDDSQHSEPVDNYMTPVDEAVSSDQCLPDTLVNTDELPINTDYPTHDQILNTDNGLQVDEAVNTDNVLQTCPIDTEYIKIGIMLTPDDRVVKNKMSDEDSIRTSNVSYEYPVSSQDPMNITNRQNVQATCHTDNYSSNDEPLDLSMKSTKITSFNNPSNLPLIPKTTTSFVGTMNEDIPLNIKLMTLRSRSFPTISNLQKHKQTEKHSKPTAFPLSRGIEKLSKSGSPEVNVQPQSKIKKKRKPGHGMNFWFSRGKRRRTKSAVSNGLASDLSLTNLKMKNDRTLSKVAKKTNLDLNPSVDQTPSNSAGQGRTKKTRNKRKRRRNKPKVAINENLILRRRTRSMSQPHECTIEILDKETLMQYGNRNNNKRKRHNRLNARQNQGNGKRRQRSKQQNDVNSQCQGKATDINKSQPLQNVRTGKNIDQTIVAEGETKMRTRSGTKQLPDSLTDKFDQQLIGNLIFDCHLCSRQFFRRSHLESHLKFRHGFPQSETVNEKSNTPDVCEPYKFLGSPQNSSMDIESVNPGQETVNVEQENLNPEQDCNDVESINLGQESVKDIESIKLGQESINCSGVVKPGEKKTEESSSGQFLKKKFRWENDSSVESDNELDVSSNITKRNNGAEQNEKYGVQSAKSRKKSGKQTKSVNRNQTKSVSRNQTKSASQRKKIGNQRADCLKLQSSNKCLENSEQNETENILNQNRGVDCVKEENRGQVTISNQCSESSDLQFVVPVDRGVDCIKEDIQGPSNLGKKSSNESIKDLDSIQPVAKIKFQRGQKWLSCDYCERSFNRKYRYNRHLMICHSTEKWERKTCEYCNSQFPVGFNLTLHVFMQHTSHNQKAVFSCRFCALTTIHLGAMHTHVQATHREEYKNIITTSVSCPNKEEIKVVVCKICGTFYRNNRQFESHLLEMHGDVLEAQKLEKGVAHRCFLKQNLTNEVLIKDTNDFYKCLYCPVKFLTEENVSVHITESHIPIKLKEESSKSLYMYRCSFCKYKNKTIHLVKIHMGLHHWEAENFCTVFRK